jgi:hypothetical protein
LHKMVIVSLFLLAAILMFVIYQIFTASYYDISALVLASCISYGTTIIIMAILAQKFLSWYRSSRNTTVILYGISSIAFLVNIVFALCFLIAALSSAPGHVTPHIGTGYIYFSLGDITSILRYGLSISSILSFTSWWFSTISVLRHYSEGSKRYWLLLCIPLVYFLIQFQPLFIELFSTFLYANPVLFSTTYTLIVILSNPIGGILFSIVFWGIARKIDDKNIVRTYIAISGFGLVILFVSNQAIILASLTFPPYGLATISFLGLSSYLVLVGIYSSTISISQDSALRQLIRKFAKESKLLDSIATTQMEQEINRHVIDILKENQESMTQATGIESSMTDDEVKRYLSKVIEEVKGNKDADGVHST